MQSSYKIAIVTLVVILVVVFAYYLQTPGEGGAPQRAVGEVNDLAGSQVIGGSAGRDAAAVEALSPADMAHIAKSQLAQAASSEASEAAEAREIPRLGAHGGEVGRQVNHTTLIDRPTASHFGAGVPTTQPTAALPPTTQPGQQIQSLFEPTDGTVAAAGPQSAGITVLDRTPRTQVTGNPRSGTAPGTYTIKSGDTFSTIAADKLGSSKKWHAIAQANPMIDPTKLKVGMVIRLPDPTGSTHAITAGESTTREPETAPGANGVVYVVREGDTLTTIAQQYYGSRGKWERIFNANRATIGRDPGRVKAGMKLVIPPGTNPAR
jgi:nucleoid-associated protein YgaU